MDSFDFQTGIRVASPLYIYDTTLRDGAQRAGISFSVHDKVNIARRLDEFGVHYIEGGWPGSNPKDSEFFEILKSQPLKKSVLVSFGSTRRPGRRAESDPSLQAILRSETPACALVGKSSKAHVTLGLCTTLEENLSMIEESVKFAKEHGLEVIFDAEHFFDGFKEDPDYALKTLLAAEQGGADFITLCDTNGGSLPQEVLRAVEEVKGAIRTRLGIHAHDDIGVAVANTLSAATAGVSLIQGTINGYGERCGNADLIAVIPDLILKMGVRSLDHFDLTTITDLAHYVSEIANMPASDAQPYAGRNAFTHKAGIHVSALMRNPSTYEHVDPARVGNSRRILVSELSGKSNIVSWLQGKIKTLVPRSVDDPALPTRIVEKVKDLEYQGYQFEGAQASLELMILRLAEDYKPLFRLESYRVLVGKRESDSTFAEATVSVFIGDRHVHTASEGNGPVNALDKALRKALREVYPAIDEFNLLDYKVRVLEGSKGTDSKVRVLIETGNGGRTWSTVGVSENIIEASWQALADSLEYGLRQTAGS